MNETEQLLTVLIEECSEVQKACTKALRFGLDDTWPGPESGLPEWKLTPRQEIHHELNDIRGILTILRSYEILPEVSYEDDVEEDAKVAKVLKMLRYSENAGTLR